MNKMDIGYIIRNPETKELLTGNYYKSTFGRIWTLQGLRRHFRKLYNRNIDNEEFFLTEIRQVFQNAILYEINIENESIKKIGDLATFLLEEIYL